MGYAIYQKHMHHNPVNPKWANRDRFVLSPGHGCMLLYSLLHLTGYEEVTLEQLKQFRQWGSKTPGHSEFGHTKGVETTTGPLGQGFANGVGMAIAQKISRGLLQSPRARDRGLQNLCDCQRWRFNGRRCERSGEPGRTFGPRQSYLPLRRQSHLHRRAYDRLVHGRSRKRFEAYGWDVQIVNDGNDLAGINAAIEKAKTVKNKPHIINVHTIIGFGSPNKHDTHDAHGSPLGPDEVKLTKSAYGWDPNKDFFVPDAALAEFRKALENGKKSESAWNEKFSAYKRAFPDLAQQFEDWHAKKLPAGWADALPTFAGEKPMATRVAQQKVLVAIAPKLPMLLGGSADLAPSTNTIVKETGNFQSPENKHDTGTYAGRNFHFGVA